MLLFRVPIGIFLACAVGCTTHDYDKELGRVGGPLPDAHVVFPDAAQPPDAQSDASPSDAAIDVDAGDAGDAGGDVVVDTGPPPILFCEAFKVMKVCRRCHQAPSPVGAPFPLQTWEDTQGVHLNRPIVDRMIGALEINFMPLRALPIEVVNPPIQPLDPTCKNTLLTWLREGAKPVGGTDCDPNLSCVGCTNFP